VASQGCDHETTNKVLLAVDGVIQAAGAITVVSGLLTPSRPVVATRHFSIAEILPTTFGSGRPGIAALGNF
jgi:hypothetical protein